MAENSKIEWTDHTFNPWVGCTKVSPACDHCYAESWAKRTGAPELWAGKRRRTTAANWRQPLKWNHSAALAGVRPRVFCASLADVLDNEVPDQWRHDLFSLIHDTPNLDWLLLTKRIGNVGKLVDPSVFLELRNIWLGATVVTQEEADRDIPKLIAVPARVRFLSMEPLLGPVDLVRAGFRPEWKVAELVANAPMRPLGTYIDWVIVGGESGPRARRMDIKWCEQIADQCGRLDVPFFMKQGSQANWTEYKNFAEFPDSVRVRQFPRAGCA